MDTILWAGLTILRLVVPLTIMRWPLIGLLASITIDSNDYYILPLSQEGDYTTYQSWDKLLDLYYLAFAAAYAYKINDKYIRRVAMGLFAWRMVGVAVLEITQDRTLLPLFPNVFENFIIFYLLYKLIEPDIAMPRSKLVTFIVVIGLAIPKVLQEQYLHVTETRPTDVLGGVISLSTAMYLAYAIIPIAMLGWLTTGFKSFRKDLPRRWITLRTSLFQRVKP